MVPEPALCHITRALKTYTHALAEVGILPDTLVVVDPDALHLPLVM